jgi:hypothetical protein
MKKTLQVLAISLVAMMAVPALAQSPEASTLPVSEPLDVGGTILQPGTYLIRVVAPRADRNKVQITSLDRQTIYATVLTVPHELEPNEEIPSSTFVYFPAGEGQPRALRTWFAPDPASGGGHDIVYDEARARQLARLSHEDVVTYRGEQTADLSVVTPEEKFEPYVYTPPVTTPAPVTTQAEISTTTTTTVNTTPLESTIIDSEPMTSAAAVESTNTNTEVEMPQTASKLPLVALLGLMSLAAAIVVRIARGA